MPRAHGHEALNGFDRLDASSGAESGAVESGGCAGELELARKTPSLKESVDEAGVEDIAGPSGIPRLDSKGGGVVKLRAVPA